MDSVDRFLPRYSFFDTVYLTATSFPPLVLTWGFYVLYSLILYYVVTPFIGIFYTIVLFGIAPPVLLSVLRSYVPPKPPRSPREFQPSSKTYGKNGAEIAFRNPATGEPTGTFSSYSTEDVQAIVSNAHVAQAEWAKTSFSERVAVLHDLMQHIIQDQDNICKYSMQDTGKTQMEALYGEILTSCAKIDYLIKEGAQILSPESRSPPLWLLTKSAWVEYHPLGVIGIIVPWNYPFHNVLSAVVTAIFSGNAAVVKVSEFATSSKDYFESIFRTVLTRRGHSPDLVTLVSGYGQTGEALIKAPGMNHVFFIGSPQTGKKVMSAATDRCVPVTLELGGKDAFIVFEDVNIDHVIQVALRGVFVNCGQNCIASERIYVHSKIYDEFVDKITKAVKSLRSGAGYSGEHSDIGSVTMELGVKKCLDLVSDAVAHGAKILAGGTVKENQKEHTLFFDPTILVNVNHSMKCVQEEAFGPLMLIMKFDTEEEVIQKANDSIYALGCSIFSQNRARAERVGKQIVSGMLTINDFGVSYLVQSCPFGGVKTSGFGKFNGPEGLRSFCNVKTVVSGRFDGGVLVPRFSAFPVLKEARDVVKGLIGVLYQSGFANKVKAVQKLIEHRKLLS